VEELRERIKNLVVFKEGSHKKRRDHPVYYTEIKTYYLVIAMYRMSERPSDKMPSTVRCWTPTLRQFPQSVVGLKYSFIRLHSTGEKDFEKPFSKIPTQL